MSRRSSSGDLVPRDISEILAREGKAQRGPRKQAGSLGQAFSWLKGSRKKKNVGNGLNGSGIGVADVKLGYHNHEPGKGLSLLSEPSQLVRICPSGQTAGPKGHEEQKRLAVHYTTSQHYQENVFIEGSRPQYLEDLHTEAQEGLKIQQLQEHKNGVNFPDDTSIASADTLQPEQAGSRDRGDSPTGTTDGNSVTTATSTMSAVSARPVLTRQASTFKPLNPVKTIDKSKKRSRRTTIMGIPQQVQKELALQRNSTFQQLAPTQLPNGTGQNSDSQSGLVIIPTVDGESPLANQEGARVHLTDLETSREEQLLRHHLHAVYHDDYQGLSAASNQRPKSLAVPGMTTSSSPTLFGYLQEPQGPVMSISPQATYLSKIIPNAVLPASVDVIQIDRSSRTRGSNGNHGGSVRTVSKSSLASVGSSGSSASSRRSEGDGSHAEPSLSSTTMPTKAPGSNWSPSLSSERTITSNPSVTSSNQRTDVCSPQAVDLAGQGSQPKQPAGHQDHIPSRSPSVMSANSSKAPGSDSGSVTAGDVSNSGQESVRNSQSFTRSLSVMKTKLPPAPPRRTNSLHHNKIRTDSSSLVVVKDLSDSVSGEEKAATNRSLAKDEASVVAEDISKTPACLASCGPLVPGQVTSGGTGGPELHPESTCPSPQKTPSEEGKFDRTLSPSSGYSSQSGTPTLSPKGISPTSPDKQKKKPVKPERSGSRASSSAASASSSLTSLSSSTSEPVNPEVLANNLSPPQQHSVSEIEKTPSVNSAYSPAATAVRELFNIPPPPKVKAPCPPPPETWAHSKRTFELLCGPCPRQTHLQKPLQLKDSAVQKTVAQTGAGRDPQVLDENQTSLQETTLPLPENKESVLQDNPEKVLTTVTEGVALEVESMISPGAEQDSLSVAEKTDASMEVQTQEQLSQRPLDKDTESGQPKSKKEPPPVMKKPVSVSLREESVSGTSVGEQQHTKFDNVTIEVHSPPENDTSLTQEEVKGSADQSELEMKGSEVTSEEPPTPDTAMHTLPVDSPKVKKVSPPPSPSPPPAYQPTPPPTRKTPPSSVSTPPPEEIEGVREEETHITESSWPPPPPPLEGDSVFDGVDELDFPPPPPPLADGLPDVVESCVAETDVPYRPPVAPEEAGVTMENNIETGKSVNAESTDLPSIVAQTVVEDITEDAVTQGSTVETVDVQTSYGPVMTDSSLSDDVSPAPSETPPSPTTAPLSHSPLAPPTSVPPPPPLPPVSASHPHPVSVALTHTLPAESHTCSSISFRRQPSLANRESRSKELLSRHKTTPHNTPKEDANIPLVTPSLLQMVRLRSVMAEDQVNAPSEENKSTEGAPPTQENCPVSTPGSQGTPQKPIRKSLSQKSASPAAKASVTLHAPSMRLQEAIRMKTAAMSSRDGLPSRMGLRPSISSSGCESGFPYPKSPEGGDVYKSPASTASFIFSRSTKKVVIETAAASSPEAQASLKQSLAAELMQVSDQSKASHASSDGVKSDKVPPPVAKKPLHGSSSPSHKPPVCYPKTELGMEVNGAVGTVQPVTTPNELETTTTTVTPDTIETLF